jgi:hypothetical protein
MRVFEQVSEEYPIGQAHTLKPTMVLSTNCMYVCELTTVYMKSASFLSFFIMSRP